MQREPADRHAGASPRDPRERAAPSPGRILVVEDDAAMAQYLQESLVEEGFAAEVALTGRGALDRIRPGDVDVVVTDLNLPDLHGLDLLREIKALADPPPHVIAITAFGSIDTAIKAMKFGAYDYLTKPFEIEELVVAVEKALGERKLHREVQRLRREVQGRYTPSNMVGKSAAMQEVFDLIRRLAQSSSNVLITGESGTGKELVARAIHYNGPRASRPFVPVNCAAIPDNLLESELFGHKRGAFTDARNDRQGMFLEADGGTIFLDEVTELPFPLQAKLLRVIQEREVRPLGASRSERIDVRIISATNRNLENLLQGGHFREDLYYRLNVINVAIPPLRDRAEDTLPLAEHFLRIYSARAAKRVTQLQPAAAKLVLGYPWPGNVRELENVMERAVALVPEDAPGVRADDLPPHIRERRSPDLLAGAVQRRLTLAELEREYIFQVLQSEAGNKTRAAQFLGLDRKTLYRKLEEYGRLESGDSGEVHVLREDTGPVRVPGSAGGGGGSDGNRS
jgi:DNA-binding NtrC family response regulator